MGCGWQASPWMCRPTTPTGAQLPARRRCCAGPTAKTGRSRRNAREPLASPAGRDRRDPAGAGRREGWMSLDDAFEIERSLPAGHVNAALAMARRLGTAEAVGSLRVPGAGSMPRDDPRQGDLPGIEARDGPHAGAVDARLGAERGERGMRTTCTSRWIGCSSARTGSRTGSPVVTSWDGEMVLYDVSSSYFEGRTCPLAKLGYSRDGKGGLPQIIYGLFVTAMAGRSRSRCSPVKATRRQDTPRADRQAQGPLRAVGDRGGRGSRDGHQGEHRAPRRGPGG